MHRFVILLCFSSMLLQSQVAAPPPFSRDQAHSQSPASATPAMASTDMTPLLAQLQQNTQNINLDLARLRIEKWKVDSNVREQAQQNSESISRNISAALPGIADQVRNNPQSLAAAFKLYRNVNALYDVLASLTESAGAFGPKNEYQTLAQDVASLDGIRRAIGEKIESFAALKDSESVRLRTLLSQASAAPAPPKKIIVDDAEPRKTSPKKKKPAAATPLPQ